jgi:hypothetical protein
MRLPSRLGMLALLATLPLTRAAAQADEVQVYTGGLAAVGTFNITLHNNVTPKGIRSTAFPGGVTSDHSWNGVPEFAYGVTSWFEAGLYLPLYTLDQNQGFGLDGFKLRGLVARPNGDSHVFAFGLGYELGFNAKRWDPNRVSSEFRPILAWHLSKWDLVANPIVDTDYKGGFKKLDFAPSARVAYNVDKTWAVAVEEYADLGTLDHLIAGTAASHQLWGALDHAGKVWDMEVGAGYGLTDSADKFTLKLILARDLYTRKR